MLRVGLTGGLATGKSFVGRTLRDLGQDAGCLLIQADELGHEVQQPGGEAYQEIVREFGRGMLKDDGSIDRRRLAAEVFRDQERLQKLNEIIHPAVRARIRKLEQGFAQDHPHGMAITEAAILVETGSYRDYDRLIVTVCRPEQQIERAVARDHLTRDEALDRIHRQMPLEEKVKFADYVIDTSGPKEDTLVQTRAVYESLRSLSL